ncbi:MAG: helix-turn-helix domain-containing protein [Jiangellaceae bacterium]
MDAAQLVSRARIDARLTQTEMAQRAATSQAAVARYEAGTTSPSVRTLERLLRAAGKTLVLSAVDAPAADLTESPIHLLRRYRTQILREVRKSGASRPRIVPAQLIPAAASDHTTGPVVLVDVDGPFGSRASQLVQYLQVELVKVDQSPVMVITPEMLPIDEAQRAVEHAVPL